MNEHNIIYEINGDEIEYYDPNDPEIIPVPSPSPHHSIQPHPYPHNIQPEDHINNSTFTDFYTTMLSFNAFVTISMFAFATAYVIRCYYRLIYDWRTERNIRNNNRRRRINIDNLNTLLLCDELPDDTCSICLEEFKEGEKIKNLNCNHIFHEECLLPWLNDNDYCPMCRQNII